MTVVLVEVRCWRCNRKLAEIEPGARHAVKCPKCHAMNQGPEP